MKIRNKAIFMFSLQVIITEVVLQLVRRYMVEDWPSSVIELRSHAICAVSLHIICPGWAEIEDVFSFSRLTSESHESMDWASKNILKKGAR